MITYSPPLEGVDEEWPHQFRVGWPDIMAVTEWCKQEFRAPYCRKRYCIFGFTVMIRSTADAALFRLKWC